MKRTFARGELDDVPVHKNHGSLVDMMSVQPDAVRRYVFARHDDASRPRSDADGWSERVYAYFSTTYAYSLQCIADMSI